MGIVPDYDALPLAAPVGMTPTEEQRLKLRVSIILNSLATGARLFTMNDQALGLVLQQAAMDVTTLHWDRYKTMYEALKGK